MWQLSIICIAFSVTYARHVTNNIGSSSSKMQIIGGHDIDIREAPYQVSIIVKYPGPNNTWRHFCGGSIITKDIILTAAHCLICANTSDILVRVGSSNSKSGGLIVPIANSTWHSNYSRYIMFDYDVGLAKLSTPLEFSDTVKPIAMINDGEEIADGAMINITGWGTTSENSTQISIILQKASVQKVNDHVCRSAYTFDHQFRITPRMLCTGVPGGGKNPCHGDSGGPLVHNEKVVGMPSFGWGCAEAKFPAVNVKISALRTWIDENIKLLTGE